MQGVSFAGGGYVLVPLAAFAIALLWRRRRADAILVGAAAVAEETAVTVTKSLAARVRPTLPHAAASGFSFPSGHATAAAVTAVLLVWLAAGRPRWQVGLAVAGGGVWVALVCLSRLVLRVHYFTDVLGGVGLGVAVAAGLACAPGMARGIRQRFLSRPVRVPTEQP